MGLIADINQLIAEHGSSSILRERLATLRDDLQRLQEKNDRLEAEHQRALSDNERLREELAKKSIPDEYTEHRGVLFRRFPSGTIQDEAYCPACKIPMTSLADMLPFACSACKRQASFTGKDLYKVISEIQG
jgi:hypothetical protein